MKFNLQKTKWTLVCVENSLFALNDKRQTPETLLYYSKLFL